MKRLVAIVGVAALGVGLASWAALAWAQSSGDKISPANNSPSESAFALPGTGPATSTIKPTPDGRTVAPLFSQAPPPSPRPSGGIVPVGPMSSIPPLPPIPGATTENPLVPKPAPAAPPANPAAIASPAPTTPSAAPSGAPPMLPSGAEAVGAPNETASATAPPADEHAESTITADNTTGRQEPAISLEWVGPPVAKVGQAGGYSLVVRNACNIPVQQVMVRVRVPAGINCLETEPKAVSEGGVLVWELGMLQAKQEKVLQMKMLADQKGDVSPQAWVTFTGSSVMRIKIREPKLQLKASAPVNVMIGETAAFSLTITNPGDGSADQVKIHAVLSEGLESPRGPKIDFDIGNLAAGETRTVNVVFATKTGGAQRCEAVVDADGGLHAKETATVNVITPRLDLSLMGPGLRYLGRKAMYTIKIANPGDAPASNVTVSDEVPEGFKVLAASDGGRHDFQTRTVSWFVGEIGPGQSREVKFEVQAINPGEFKHKVSAAAARGLRAESELSTRVEGLSALMLEMVDTEDPIEVNSETAYEVRITNTGSKMETDIKLIATIPDKMVFKSATGPARFHEEGKLIVFEPIEKLAPRADAIFRINVKAAEAGTVRFKIQMTSTNLVEPVIKMEATRIYSDAPEVKSSGH